SLYKICEYVQNLLDIKGGFVKYGDEDDGKVLIASADPHFNNFLSILISGAIIFKENQFKKINNKFDFKNWLLWGEEGRNIYGTLGDNNNELKSAFYKDEGHFIFRKTYQENPVKEIYLHLDAAPLGFLSIAAHGHADALSIILTLDGNPILVDAGTYSYHTEKEWRKYFVSTVAHNTICIDNINQAKYIGPTMWLEHYNVNILNTAIQTNLETVSAKHSGYNKIDCSHERVVEFNSEKEFFIITDKISVSKEDHTIFQPWHLHPEVSVEKIDTHTFILQHHKANRKLKVVFSSLLNIEIIKGQTGPVLGWYSPSFLKKEPTNVLHCFLETNSPEKIILTTILQII
ncbi:MAG: heparinase II/III-family protein, partial [Ginsengibacter sp.]